MDTLNIQITFDEIGRQMIAEGNAPDDIRLFFEDEGDRVAQEIEDEMENHE